MEFVEKYKNCEDILKVNKKVFQEAIKLREENTEEEFRIIYKYCKYSLDELKQILKLINKYLRCFKS